MRVVATVSFVGETSQELNFKKGDIIILLEGQEILEPGWLKGICNGKNSVLNQF